MSLRELNLTLNGLRNMTFNAADFPHLQVRRLPFKYFIFGLFAHHRRNNFFYIHPNTAILSPRKSFYCYLHVLIADIFDFNPKFV